MALVEQLRLEEISTARAVAYIALAIRQSLWCWPAALISSALAVVVVLDARLYMDVALQAFYVAMAVYGWQQWRRGGNRDEGVRVHRWPLWRHAIVAGLIALASLLFWLVLRDTRAAYPFLDSLATVASVVATFMLAHKLIENWIYWFVIDAILVYVYFARDLFWFSGLYAGYLVMVVIGFRAWQKSLRDQVPPDAGLAH